MVERLRVIAFSAPPNKGDVPKTKDGWKEGKKEGRKEGRISVSNINRP
jgi:hypothetical protein